MRALTNSGQRHSPGSVPAVAKPRNGEKGPNTCLAAQHWRLQRQVYAYSRCSSHFCLDSRFSATYLSREISEIGIFPDSRTRPRSSVSTVREYKLLGLANRDGLQ